MEIKEERNKAMSSNNNYESIESLNEDVQMVDSRTPYECFDSDSEFDVSKVSYRGEYLLIENGPSEYVWYPTENLIKRFFEHNYSNPFTHEAFTEPQRKYYAFLMRRFTFIEYNFPTEQAFLDAKHETKMRLFAHFKKGVNVKDIWNRIDEKERFFNNCRLLLGIDNFAEHFMDFRPEDSQLDSMIRHERTLAEDTLNKLKSDTNYWLMRHSSQNRNMNCPKSDRYYAISKQTPQGGIDHILMANIVGKGWGRGKDTQFVPCFFDMLRHLSISFNLNLADQITSYFMI